MITLPDGTTRTIPEALHDIFQYNVKGIIDLYDRVHPMGPHDKLMPGDLLAINALNAFAMHPPAAPMADQWCNRHRVDAAARTISKAPLSMLSEEEREVQRDRLISALEIIQEIPEYGGQGTRAAKLLHRLRPNIMPIYDEYVGGYHQSEDWAGFIDDVWDWVLNHGNGADLQALSQHMQLSELRIWDILLWFNAE